MDLPPVIFGTMANRQSDDRTRIDLFHRAVEIGISTFDTAPLYEFGRSENQLGEAFGNSESVQILTKVGLRWDNDGHGDILFEFTDDAGTRRAVRRDSRPDSVRWEVEQSLVRLKRDALDLVQVHHPDEHTPIEDTMGALLDLKAQGKVREIGVSNYSPTQIVTARDALGDIPLATLQPDYSLLNRHIEDEIVPLCQRLGIDIISYSPLAGGRLSQRPRWKLPGRVKNAVNGSLARIAQDHGVSLAVIAMAWVAQQPGITAPIFGASTREQLEDLAGVTSVTLSGEELTELDEAFSEWRMASFKAKAKKVIRRLLGM